MIIHDVYMFTLQLHAGLELESAGTMRYNLLRFGIQGTVVQSGASNTRTLNPEKGFVIFSI